jgi:hypothetical protein
MWLSTRHVLCNGIVGEIEPPRPSVGAGKNRNWMRLEAVHGKSPDFCRRIVDRGPGFGYSLQHLLGALNTVGAQVHSYTIFRAAHAGPRFIGRRVKGCLSLVPMARPSMGGQKPI